MEQDSRRVDIWKFIEFSDIWSKCDTFKLDEISPSWFRRKDDLEKNSTEYASFIEQIKRKHAVETGVIERMYDISKGVTETLIEKGFEDVLLSHGDFSDNVTKDQLLNHLNDNLSAVDAVFDFVKNQRLLTVGFINELHQIVTAHQDFAEGRDQFGTKFRIALIKGRFKERENNPSRSDGETKITFLYAPPEHVSAEMDNLISIYSDLIGNKVHPAIIAAWFHHAFSIIHPYQDGNGRLARLLASLIFIKSGLFPLTVAREDAKDIYLKALQDADNGLPQPLVDYFIDIQRENIEKALNIKSVNTTSFSQVADVLSAKLKDQKARQEKERQSLIERNRGEVFQICYDLLNKDIKDLQTKTKGFAHIYIRSCKPNDLAKRHYFTYQIVDFANKHDYYFNRFLPRGWFRLVFEITDQKTYQLIFSLHHFGYEDDSFAIGAFLEFIEAEDVAKNIRDLSDENFRTNSDGMIITTVPLPIKPYKLSLDVSNNSKERKENINQYLDEILTIAIAQIASEIT